MTPTKRDRFALVAFAALAVFTAAGCGGKHGLEQPIQTVGGTDYYTVTGRAGTTGHYDFTKKLAWLSAASELSRARSAEVYVRLTRTQQAQLEELLDADPGEGREEIAGVVSFIDEVTSDAPLRNLHELRVREKDDKIAVTVGVPMDTWQELVDEAAEEVEKMLEGEVIDLESSRGGGGR